MIREPRRIILEGKEADDYELFMKKVDVYLEQRERQLHPYRDLIVVSVGTLLFVMALFAVRYFSTGSFR